jgi:photosystem II stability/assembly factor-like uncharacterized protein
MAKLLYMCAIASLAGTLADDAKWYVLKKQFSAISIGIGFKDDKTGWTTYTTGSSAPQIVKTIDGGITWNPVTNTTGVPLGIVLDVAAAKGGPLTDVVVQGALESDKWSLDGENFKQSIGAPIVGQDVEINNGRVVMAGGKGPCFSSTAGAIYTCKAASLKVPQSVRYVSAPSKDVIYLSAGQWPSSKRGSVQRADGSSHVEITQNLRIISGQDGSRRMELGPVARSNDHPANETYNAELLKSTDGGNTWTSLFSDEGNFYFNDIDCIDEDHCVAVGEGFAHDGSGAAGARIYTISDGKTVTLSHFENATGTESLMAAKMLSQTEHWAGGTQQTGGLMSPAFMFHSTDGGKTYTNENNAIRGQMVTNLDFVSPTHGYATTVNALQISSLLEFATTAPPSPPPPAPPTPGMPHYEKPPCQAGEAKASVQGTTGSLCAAACTASGGCPTDVPPNVTAVPQCILKDQSGDQYCALECDKDAECDVAGGSKCSILQAGKGVCTYSGLSNLVMTTQSAASIMV